MITLRDLTRTFRTPAGAFTALRGVDLDIERGSFTAVVGKSGSGKSTLLNLVGGIDRPTSGTVTVDGTDIGALNADASARWRGRNVGIVFQFFQLLPTLTVLENVILPMDFAGTFPAGRRAGRARELLDRVDLADQAGKLPSALSGGQQQRVAIARALANDPPLLLADEPTGNLDSATSGEIFNLFGACAAEGRTVVVVTHERDAASHVGRTITLADGCLAS